MQLIWHGTASVELICAAGRILFDPFVPLPGSKVPVRPEDFDGFTDIFLTHGHLDHIVSVPGIVKRNPGATVCCTGTPCETLRAKGVPDHYDDTFPPLTAPLDLTPILRKYEGMAAPMALGKREEI